MTLSRRPRTFRIVVCVSLAALALLIVGAALIERWTYLAPIRRLDARLRAEGLPTTWVEARAAAPRPPAGLDATAEWEQFLAANADVRFDYYDFESSEAESAPWRRELRRLADQGGYRFTSYAASRIADADYEIAFDETMSERGVCLFLLARAEAQAERGDADGAADSVDLALAVARNAKYDPFLLCRRCSALTLLSCCRRIEGLLVAGPLADARLEELQQALAACDLMEHDASMALHETLLDRDFASSARFDKSDLNFAERSFARRALAGRLDLSDRRRRAFALPAVERLVEFAAIDAESARRRQEPDAYVTQAARDAAYYRGAGELAYGELVRLEAESLRRATIAALACRRFEAAEGRLPSRWSDLIPFGVGQPPRGPFSNDPMRLVPTEAGGVSIEAKWPPKAIAVRDGLPPIPSHHPEPPFEGLTLEPLR